MEDTRSPVAEDGVATEAPEVAEATATPELPTNTNWYVIHTYSGYENKVKTNLEHRIASMDMKDKIFQVVIPVEDEVEVKDGQRRTVQRKVFPGLRSGSDADERRFLVRRAEHARGDRFRRVGQSADRAAGPRGQGDPQADERRRRRGSRSRS